ncbi:GMC family oxidoreductase [Streptacidiphilus sp. N1-10]|uniref:GMC family oxidoreductase n=1 Tax=Streptacidiphilus jeojiensis TaxID=3229225 RepID=A0ABV6XFR9_9ACTN
MSQSQPQPARLGGTEARVLARFCDLVVPGSVEVGAVDYIERALERMSLSEEDAVHAAIGVAAGAPTPERMVDTEAFETLRALAIEAYYGDYLAPGRPGPGGHAAIGFDPPAARRLRKDWGFLDASARPQVGGSRGSGLDDDGDRAAVVVVGSGAGGGLIAAELGALGHDVLLVEAGGLHQADSYTRFELEARGRLWWPARFAVDPDDPAGQVALLAGRCVGGSTVINTKVAMRAHPEDIAKFHARTGLLGPHGRPFAPADLQPWYERVESWLGVRPRSDWTPSVHRVGRGLAALGASWQPVDSYTDHNCTRCGACLTGCPSNAGKSALNTFIAPALGRGSIRLRTGTLVDRVLIDRSGGRARAVGVAVTGPDGSSGTIAADTVVLAAGALNTPQILLRSPEFTELDSPSSRLAGRTLGLHPARLVYGLFDEVQDCHMVYPISAHTLDHQRDSDGGFVIEGTTIQDPVSFAQSLVDDGARPLWGAELTATVAAYRRWAGLLVMATDENTGTVDLDPRGHAVVTKRFSATERHRLDRALDFAVAALRAAGAREVVRSSLSSSHVQGSVPMGDDPDRSAVDGNGQVRGVTGLYVGDASLIPASLSVNPSLTVMALAARVADHLAKELPR